MRQSYIIIIVVNTNSLLMITVSCNTVVLKAHDEGNGKVDGTYSCYICDSFDYQCLCTSNTTITCCALCCVRALACASRVAELNPYVSVAVLTHQLNQDSDLGYLSQFQVHM